MGEVEIVTECSNCGTEFDESYDTEDCLFCNESFCEDCQNDHAKEVLFYEGSANQEIKNYIEKLESDLINKERSRVRKLKKK